jgi:hypothetical protein
VENETHDTLVPRIVILGFATALAMGLSRYTGWQPGVSAALVALAMFLEFVGWILLIATVANIAVWAVRATRS